MNKLRWALLVIAAVISLAGTVFSKSVRVGGDELEPRIAVEDPAVDDPRDRQRGVRRPKDFLMQRILVPVRLAGRVGGVEKQRLAARRQQLGPRFQGRQTGLESRQVRAEGGGPLQQRLPGLEKAGQRRDAPETGLVEEAGVQHQRGLIAGGFTPSQLDLMANLTRIMAAAQIFFGFSSFLTGIIQSHKRFLIPALSPVLYNLGIIFGIVILGKSIGIYGAAFGVVLGALMHLVAQIPLAHRLGFRHSLTLHRQSAAVKEMGRLMVPRMLTLSLIQIESTAIITFSSWLSSGTVTLMSIAQQLSGLPVRLIGIPIGQASLPFFSRESGENDIKGLAAIVNNTILEMLYLALPASAIVLVLRIPLVRLAYGADSFPWAETVTTGKLVAILAVSIAARSLTHIMVRVFYALHNTTTPFVISLLSTIINICLSYYFLFVIKSGVVGMAIAVTIASIVETFVLICALYKLAQFSLSHIAGPFFKMLIVTIITAVSLWVPLRVLDQLIFDTTRTVPLIFLTITVGTIGLAVYLALSYLFEIRQLAVFVRLGKKIGNWQKALGLTRETLDTSETPV